MSNGNPRQQVDNLLSNLLSRQANIDQTTAAIAALGLAPQTPLYQAHNRLIADFAAGYLSRTDVFTILGV